MRVKFNVVNRTQNYQEGHVVSENLNLQVVGPNGSDEDKAFQAKFPNGSLSLYIVDPNSVGVLGLDGVVFAEFSNE